MQNNSMELSVPPLNISTSYPEPPSPSVNSSIEHSTSSNNPLIYFIKSSPISDDLSMEPLSPSIIAPSMGYQPSTDESSMEHTVPSMEIHFHPIIPSVKPSSSSELSPFFTSALSFPITSTEIPAPLLKFVSCPINFSMKRHLSSDDLLMEHGLATDKLSIGHSLFSKDISTEITLPSDEIVRNYSQSQVSMKHPPSFDDLPMSLSSVSTELSKKRHSPYIETFTKRHKPTSQTTDLFVNCYSSIDNFSDSHSMKQSSPIARPLMDRPLTFTDVFMKRPSTPSNLSKKRRLTSADLSREFPSTHVEQKTKPFSKDSNSTLHPTSASTSIGFHVLSNELPPSQVEPFRPSLQFPTLFSKPFVSSPFTSPSGRSTDGLVPPRPEKNADREPLAVLDRAEDLKPSHIEDIRRCKSQMLKTHVHSEHNDPQTGEVSRVTDVFSFCNHGDLDDNDLKKLVHEMWEEITREQGGSTAVWGGQWPDSVKIVQKDIPGEENMSGPATEVGASCKRCDVTSLMSLSQYKNDCLLRENLERDTEEDGERMEGGSDIDDEINSTTS